MDKFADLLRDGEYTIDDAADEIEDMVHLISFQEKLIEKQQKEIERLQEVEIESFNSLLLDNDATDA